MKLLKVPALKCESKFDEIAYIIQPKISSNPSPKDWLNLAFSIKETSKVHEQMLDYPFIFSGGLWSPVKPIMTNCVRTFQNYTLVMAMTMSWTNASKTSFGTRDCMTELAQVYKYAFLLEKQKGGQLPETHPMAHPKIKNLIVAIGNIRAIDIMSSDDALTEDEAHRRFGVRCEIWRLLLVFDKHPFWGRFCNQLIQQEKKNIAELFVKITMRYSKWDSFSAASSINEAKNILPFTMLSEGKQNEIKDLARCSSRVQPLGIVSNLEKNIPPKMTGDLFIPFKSYDLTDVVELYTLEQIS